MHRVGLIIRPRSYLFILDHLPGYRLLHYLQVTIFSWGDSTSLFFELGNLFFRDTLLNPILIDGNIHCFGCRKCTYDIKHLTVGGDEENVSLKGVLTESARWFYLRAGPPYLSLIIDPDHPNVFFCHIPGVSFDWVSAQRLQSFLLYFACRILLHENGEAIYGALCHLYFFHFSVDSAFNSFTHHAHLLWVHCNDRGHLEFCCVQVHLLGEVSSLRRLLNVVGLKVLKCLRNLNDSPIFTHVLI